jgi:hypothetical protein
LTRWRRLCTVRTARRKAQEAPQPPRGAQPVLTPKDGPEQPGIAMRKPIAVACCAMFAALLCTIKIPADEPAEATVTPAVDEATDSNPRVARLVRDLGAGSFEDRQRATAELSRIGPDARAALERAANSDDAEIRLNALALLRQLKVGDLWAAGTVTCRVRGDQASSVLDLLAEQTGNHVLVGDQYGQFHDAAVNLDFNAAPFWQVLDELCRQTGNQVRHHYDTRTPGLVLVQGEPGQHPVAYAGPVRGRVTSARRVYIEELDYESLKSEITHTFQINLQMMWEDRFRLVAYRSQPELVQAVTETGVELPAAQPSGSAWNVANAGTRQLAMNLRLHPPGTAAARLAVLRLKWGLIAVGDMQSMDVVDLSSAAPHQQDGVELIVESVQERPGGRYEVTLVVHRDLVIPQPQEVLFQENEFDLFDAEGRPFRKQGQTNSLTDQGAKIRFTFAGETPGSTPKRLRFTYPRLRAEQDLEVVFRDVPLPVGRPE